MRGIARLLTSSLLFISRSHSCQQQCPVRTAFEIQYTSFRSVQSSPLSPVIARNTHQAAISRRMDPRIDELITFYVDRNPKDWFVTPPGFDDELRSKYAGLVQDARSTELDSWNQTPRGTLALILLLDQIPRNIFRGSSESFSSDIKAREIATSGIARGFDRQLGEQKRLEQFFFYVPFTHAEDLQSQVACRALVENMYHATAEGTPEKKMFETTIEMAQKHLDVILRFGRFPRRNDWMGRKTTPEEAEFLKENPSGLPLQAQTMV